MQQSLIGYSPYRNALRQARLQENQARKQAQAASAEIVRFQVTPVMLMAVMFILILLLGGLYVASFNKVATKGYMLKRLELSRQELQQQGDLKTLGLAKAKAMHNMLESGAIDHMRKPGEVSYVYADGVLARAD
jgi:hypothetical protein